MSFCKKLRIYMPLKNGVGKKITAVRQEVTGDWKGIPPHVTLLEIELGDSVIAFSDELIKLVQSCASEYIGKVAFELCDVPDDVKQFKIFTALRYNIIGESMQTFYEQVISIILKCAQVSGDIITNTTSNHIEVSSDGHMIYALPLYARNPALLKGHVSVSVTGKIKDLDSATEIIRTRLGGIIHHLSSEHFASVNVEVIDNR